MRSPAPPTDERLAIIAARLMVSRGDVLADFELETIEAADARRRFVGAAFSMTADERRVIEEAKAAMVAAPYQELAA